VSRQEGRGGVNGLATIDSDQPGVGFPINSQRFEFTVKEK